MNLKLFVEKSDEIIRRMSTEELRSCLHNIARTTPESKREVFLQLLGDFFKQQNHQGHSNEEFRCKRLMSDEKVQDKLGEIVKVFAKIENGEIGLSAQGYEDYSNGYWSSNWIWEYEDSEDVGGTLEDAVLFAQDCMNDCRYKEAVKIFKLVMDTQIFVDDEYGGDCFELSLEEMVDEKLSRINLEALAVNVLYSEYQLQTPAQRASVLYSYFTYTYFKNICIEDIFSIGREELKETDLFLQSWTSFLMLQQGDIAARLLKEGLLYYKGTDGLLEMARQGYKEHPSVYLAVLLEYEKDHDYGKMKEIAKEALEKIESDLKIRGEIAIKAAQASYCVNDSEFTRNCWFEAFYSNSTIPNYLRLFIDGEVTRRYKVLAEKRTEELPISNHNDGHQYGLQSSETVKNIVTKFEYKYLCYFSGHFDKVQNWCMEQKKSLGWRGHFIGPGVDLMLLLIYSDNKLRKAVKKIADRVSNECGFKESKNLVFMKDNLLFESDVCMQKSEEIFWQTFCLWKENYTITDQNIRLYAEWLESVIDKRVDGIVGGKYRNKYGEVALLVAALGEVKESIGLKTAKATIINKYSERYSRHSAFRGALKEYMN